jgi:Na+/H+ antiporter NhaD/arsenite permease-like protein
MPVAWDNQQPIVPLPLVIPFALLLLSIALGPLIAHRWWHRHYPDVALFLGGIIVGFYLVGLRDHGYASHQLPHAAAEYFAFLALVGGLSVACGPIVIETKGRVSPTANTLLLACGAVLANLIGTTGASMLLIRPYLRANNGRIKPLHVVFFILTVSNCGGCLTPIGDPPLYLGYLKGVPFFWSAEHLWKHWCLVNASLLAMFFVYDSRVGNATGEGPFRFNLRARPLSLLLLAAIVACVFVDVAIDRVLKFDRHGFPVGALLQAILATAAYFVAPRENLRHNAFSFEPVKEVGLLFAGIFAAMLPALAYLAQNGGKLGIDSPTAYYFATGSLSALLDNAPTYLNFLQVAVAPDDVSPQRIRDLIADPTGARTLEAVSAAAVFFGAMTYIGNGPNFMVRSIAQAAMVKTPSFFGYALWACLILLPVLVLTWAVLIR